MFAVRTPSATPPDGERRPGGPRRREPHPTLLPSFPPCPPGVGIVMEKRNDNKRRRDQPRDGLQHATTAAAASAGSARERERELAARLFTAAAAAVSSSILQRAAAATGPRPPPPPPDTIAGERERERESSCFLIRPLARSLAPSVVRSTLQLTHSPLSLSLSLESPSVPRICGEERRGDRERERGRGCGVGIWRTR